MSSELSLISDPHGDHAAMLRTLGNAGIVDSRTANWSGGNAYLVITGDLLDRGPDSRPIMDLVMRLEDAGARIAVGRVLLLTLGNHEVMNLVGDLRYVSAGEYAAFAGDETAEEREHWFQAIVVEAKVCRRLASSTRNELRAEFDRDRPPGLYAHRRAFGSDGVKYGRWLLQKPLMVVVNDTAYVHGGMPPMVAEHGLDTAQRPGCAPIYNNYVTRGGDAERGRSFRSGP